MNSTYQHFLEVANNYLGSDSTGHDFFHAQRTLNLALKLQETEGGDKYVVAVSAIMHDILRPWEIETGKSHFGEEALEIIRELLLQNNIDTSKLPKILDVISKHDIYDWSLGSKKSIELQVVQDADNLEALGAIGIARCLMYGGSHNCKLWNPGENLHFKHDYIEDGANTTTIAHFYEKLLKLKENMNTVTGQKLAQKRHEFMEKYLEEFFREWSADA